MYFGDISSSALYEDRGRPRVCSVSPTRFRGGGILLATCKSKNCSSFEGGLQNSLATYIAQEPYSEWSKPRPKSETGRAWTLENAIVYLENGHSRNPKIIRGRSRGPVGGVMGQLILTCALTAFSAIYNNYER